MIESSHFGPLSNPQIVNYPMLNEFSVNLVSDIHFDISELKLRSLGDSLRFWTFCSRRNTTGAYGLPSYQVSGNPIGSLH
jgi:hypothetical protein